jgi:glycosyltransferase involved in cell wall biosynthesis
VTPSFSVIVPTYNRPRALKNCLAALARLEYPADRFEVIVVDDGGTCDLTEALDVVGACHVRLLRTANGGPGAARNAGAAVAVHEFLAFTDDDCLPHADWLRQLADVLSSDEGLLVGGRVRNAVTGSLYSTASQTIVDVATCELVYGDETAAFFPSDNLALSRRRFAELGGFELRWAEDRDLCGRWSAQGSRMIFAADAVVDHAREMRLGSFIKQHFCYGRGAWLYHEARRRRDAGRFTVVGQFYVKGVRNCLAQRPLRRALALTVLFGVSQLANAAGFFYQARASRRQPQ